MSVKQVVYDAIMGVTGAVLDNDFDRFALAVQKLQASEWKSAEWGLHGNVLTAVRDKLYNAGASAVALSSLGPLLVAFYRDPKSAEPVEIGAAHFCRSASVNNRGRSIRIINDGTL